MPLQNPPVVIQDEGADQGTVDTINFTGSAVTASVSGSVATINVTGGGSITVEDEGVSQGTATTFNFVGSGVTASVSAGEATITVSGGGGGVTEMERLLGGGEPIIGSLYDATKSGSTVTQERWRRSSDSSNLKTIDYTYSSGRISTEVVKVYDTDGTTVLGQTTETYSWSTNPPTSTKVRNV